VEITGPPRQKIRKAATSSSSSSSSKSSVAASTSPLSSAPASSSSSAFASPKRQALRDPSKDLRSAPELMEGKRARGNVNYGTAIASANSLAVSAASSEDTPKRKALRDPSKDLSSAPELMDGKRARKTVNYAGAEVAPNVGGGLVERVGLGEAREGDDGESDPGDSEPIGNRLASGEARKGDDSESDAQDSEPIGNRLKAT
jgi:hypothetical protein